MEIENDQDEINKRCAALHEEWLVKKAEHDRQVAALAAEATAAEGRAAAARQQADAAEAQTAQAVETRTQARLDEATALADALEAARHRHVAEDART
jgi:hypothetical protein